MYAIDAYTATLNTSLAPNASRCSGVPSQKVSSDVPIFRQGMRLCSSVFGHRRDLATSSAPTLYAAIALAVRNTVRRIPKPSAINTGFMIFEVYQAD
jgi:hypothetical protein